MSRSFIKHNVVRINSDKLAKRRANRKLRRTNRIKIKTGNIENVVSLKDVSDIWDFPSDGGGLYIKDLDIKYKRK